MAKSYNPFKMWGSYVGGILAPIILLVWNSISDNENFLEQLGNFMLSLLFQGSDIYFGKLLPLFAWGIVIFGFLVGYGIHSWIRKARS